MMNRPSQAARIDSLVSSIVNRYVVVQFFSGEKRKIIFVNQIDFNFLCSCFPFAYCWSQTIPWFSWIGITTRRFVWLILCAVFAKHFIASVTKSLVRNHVKNPWIPLLLGNVKATVGLLTDPGVHTRTIRVHFRFIIDCIMRLECDPGCWSLINMKGEYFQAALIVLERKINKKKLPVVPELIVAICSD